MRLGSPCIEGRWGRSQMRSVGMAPVWSLAGIIRSVESWPHVQVVWFMEDPQITVRAASRTSSKQFGATDLPRKLSKRCSRRFCKPLLKAWHWNASWSGTVFGAKMPSRAQNDRTGRDPRSHETKNPKANGRRCWGCYEWNLQTEQIGWTEARGKNNWTTFPRLVGLCRLARLVSCLLNCFDCFWPNSMLARAWVSSILLKTSSWELSGRLDGFSRALRGVLSFLCFFKEGNRKRTPSFWWGPPGKQGFPHDLKPRGFRTWFPTRALTIVAKRLEALGDPEKNPRPAQMDLQGSASSAEKYLEPMEMGCDWGYLWHKPRCSAQFFAASAWALPSGRLGIPFCQVVEDFLGALEPVRCERATHPCATYVGKQMCHYNFTECWECRADELISTMLCIWIRGHMSWQGGAHAGVSYTCHLPFLSGLGGFVTVPYKNPIQVQCWTKQPQCLAERVVPELPHWNRCAASPGNPCTSSRGLNVTFSKGQLDVRPSSRCPNLSATPGVSMTLTKWGHYPK